MSPPDSVHILLCIVLLAVVMIASHPGPYGSHEHVHAALSSVLARGQLVIESFAPIPLLLGPRVPATLSALLSIGIHSLSILVIMRHLGLTRGSGASKWFLSTKTLPFVVGCAACVGSCVSGGDLSAPSPSASLAQLASLLSVSVSLYTRHAWFLGSAGWLESWLGVCEVIIGTCGALGANLYDLVALSLVLFAARVRQVAGQTAETEDHGSKRDRGSWKDTGPAVLCIPLLLLRSVLVTLIVPVLIYGTLFPFSEVSAGGNYHLCFLSAPARRALSPASGINAGPPPDQMLPYTLVPYSPISLYIPRAGFLWTDKLVWVDTFGVFGNQYHSGSAEDEEEAQRVFFADPLARRHPWALELASVPDHLDDRQREFVQSHLAPGEMVRLRSRITGRYLGPVEGRPSIVDRELGVGYEHGAHFRRWEVGTHANPSPSWNTTWILKYDQRRDTGLQLYNPANECSLATSFRTYVDYDGDGGNDTVKREMQRIVEATCTTGASDQASTLWIVDGKYRTRSLIGER